MENNAVGQQPQNLQVPNYSGVNIQIFNPSVNTPGSTPASAPSVSTTNYTTPTPQCYPPNYYLQNFIQPQQGQVQQPAQPVQAAPVQSVIPQDKKVEQASTTKKEKKQIVELTDDYIKNLESNLNDQNKDTRLMAAKEVMARFEEDPERKDDPALNALLNKMLQDPSKPIRLIAMSTLESRAASGNEKSVMLLSNIKKNKSENNLDAVDASNALLKMSAKTGTREIEVPVNSKQGNENKKVK